MIKIFIAIAVIGMCGYSRLPAVTDYNISDTYNDSIPGKLQGNFMDDYGIRYIITDSLWTQQPNIKYHIIRWNLEEQYLIARNDSHNPGEQNLYSRIDYVFFENMQPFEWGFCLTVYDATSDSLAVNSAFADRQNQKKGCGGYPFSRMKRN